MAINMTDNEAWVLSRLANMDFKNREGKNVTKEYFGRSLQDIAQKFYVPINPVTKEPVGHLNDFGEWGALSNKEQNEMLGDIVNGKYPDLSNLVMQDASNQIKGLDL